MNNFDRIAPVYDILSRLVFGKTILDSQTHFLRVVKSNDSLLIIGGGTGKVLNAIDELGIPTDVVYVELSRKMLNKAKARAPFKNIQVIFIHGGEEAIPESKFDIIFTAFFLDVFDSRRLQYVTTLLCRRLKDGGKWLVTDFVNNEVNWQKIMIKLMYIFFRVTTNLEGSRLLNFKYYLSHLGLHIEKEKLFYKGMISTMVFKKDKQTSLE